MPRLSLIVITKNEEGAIGRCLRSVAGIADEIVVVDGGSTDRTVEIARSLGAKVLVPEDWPGFGPQKQRAQAAAGGDWILSLDSDEWMEDGLVREIEAVLRDPAAADGYRMPRRNRFMGEIVRHGGWWPDYVLRLYRRERGGFNGNLVHESVVIEGTLGTLQNPIEHDTIVSAEDADGKIGRYAAIAADELTARGRRSSRALALLRGAAAWLRSFVLQLGFLDGRTGLRVASYQARYTYKKWALAAAPLKS
ncbi:MAG: glycosyltransferase family 2 protein [Xanthobacteraceae bacterium]|nr:glycosyltransferase family 2 protein [Xanthobacteraceae bacterium]